MRNITSFNNFVERGLQQIVDEVGVIEPEVSRKAGDKEGGFYVKFGKIRIESPQITEADGYKALIYPSEARIRNLTYAAPLYLEMTLIQRGPGGIEHADTPQDVFIGYLPIMLKSKFCLLHGLSDDELIKLGEDPKDPGGYFIINGSERVLVSQEDLAPNKPFYDYGEKATITHVAKVISIGAGYRSTITIERHKDGVIYVSMRVIPAKIPFPIIMKALGLETDEDIVLAVSDDVEIQNELYPSIVHVANMGIVTVDDARDFIGSKIAIGQPREVRIERAMQVLDRLEIYHYRWALKQVSVFSPLLVYR